MMLLLVSTRVRRSRRVRAEGAVDGGTQVLEQHDDAGVRREPQQRDAQLGAELTQCVEVATTDGIRHRIGWTVDVSDLRDGRQTPEVAKSEEAQVHELHEGRARGVVRHDERRGERVRESKKTAVEHRGDVAAKGGEVAEDCDKLKHVDREFGRAG
jgi:hypothetical protein